MGRSTWRWMQLADSAFPVGGFAHSAGLEAVLQLGGIEPAELRDFVEMSLWSTGLGLIPFVGAAFDEPINHRALDIEIDLFLLAPVTNKASRTQGRALASTAAKIFDHAEVTALDQAARQRTIFAHHAVVFGALFRHLEVSRDETLSTYLHGSVRTVLGAAVRLGAIGPYEAQRMHAGLHESLDHILESSATRTPGQATQPAPYFELLASAQERLYSKLFQS